MKESPSLLRWPIFFLLGLVTTFASTASSATSNPIKIIPLGDSINYGTSSMGIFGYRRPLHQLLLGAGYSVDFVGSQTDGSLLDFDRNHEGHSGWRDDQIADNIYDWLQGTPADIILLHIGTNALDTSSRSRWRRRCGWI